MKFVEQEKPVSTKHDALGDISFKVEVPQAESMDEIVTMCGGVDAAKDFFNSQIATNAKNVARAHARTFTVPEKTELTDEKKAELIAGIVKKGQDLSHDYSPAADTERGASKAKKAAAFDDIAALVSSGQDFTREQLFEMLQKAK